MVHVVFFLLKLIDNWNKLRPAFPPGIITERALAHTKKYLLKFVGQYTRMSRIDDYSHSLRYYRADYRQFVRLNVQYTLGGPTHVIPMSNRNTVRQDVNA